MHKGVDMRRALLVAFLVLALSLGIVAAAGAATIQSRSADSLSLQPAVSSAAAWVAGQSVDSGVYDAPLHDDYHQCDHASNSSQDSSNSY